MATKVGNLVVEMSANVARLQRDFERAKRDATNLASKFKTIFKGIGLSIAAGVSVAGVSKLIKDSLDAADQMAKLSQSVGVSVEQLSSFSHAAKLSGTSMETIGRGLGILSKNLMDFTADTGEARVAFKALGISAKDTQGRLRDADDVLAEIADKFAGMQDGAGKTALAMRMFGESGSALIPLLNQGSAGLQNMRTEAERLGLVFDTRTAQSAERVNDNFTRLQSVFTGMANNLTVQMLPTLENLSNIMAEANAETKDMELTAKALSASLKIIASSAIVTKSAFVQLGTAIGGVIAAGVTLSENLDLKKLTLKGILSPVTVLPELLTQLEESKTKLTQVSEILSSLGKDISGNLESDLATLQRIWDETASGIINTAPATGKKIAAPIIAAKAETASGTKAIKEDVQNLWLDLGERAAAIYESTRTPFEKFKESVGELQFFRDQDLIDPETYRRAFNKMAADYAATVDKMNDTSSKLSEFALEAFRSMQNVTSDVFFDVLQGDFDNLGESFRRMVNRMLADWASLKVLGSLFGSDFAKTGNLGGLFGSIAGMFGGGRATGGPVYAGTSYLVGERGPEIFMPTTSGNIIPNSQLGGTSINVPIGNIDGGNKQFIAMLPGMIEDAVLEAMRRYA
jgi:hypothetical protein